MLIIYLVYDDFTKKSFYSKKGLCFFGFEKFEKGLI